MKRYFGSLLLRRIHGGVVLQKGEYQIVASMVAELPDHLRGPVESQLNECNLAQRDVGGRTLNFYKMGFFAAKPKPLQTVLDGKAEHACLVRVSVCTPGDGEALEAELNVVAGSAFCVSFSRPIPQAVDGQSLKITTVVQAWQSSLPSSSGL